MLRRGFLEGVIAVPILAGAWRQPFSSARAGEAATNRARSRVRPGDPAWPSQASWERLRQRVEGRLIKVQSPLNVCVEAPEGAACDKVFRELKNPYYIGDDVALTQTTGWVDAWTSQPSVYAVAARDTRDVIAAVEFAHLHNLRLVVKGGGCGMKTYATAAILSDDRPGAPADNVFWSANLGEAGHYIHGFESAWLPASLLQAGERARLVAALVAASRHGKVEVHFQKGLAGARPDVIAVAKQTATNPAVLDAFALAIVGSEGPPAFPGLPGREPDLIAARRDAAAVGKAMAELRMLAPNLGSYVAESSFFERQWQRSYWGDNYARLLAVKPRYDPDGLFFVRHGVGSEAWSDDGFTRVA